MILLKISCILLLGVLALCSLPQLTPGIRSGVALGTLVGAVLVGTLHIWAPDGQRAIWAVALPAELDVWAGQGLSAEPANVSGVRIDVAVTSSMAAPHRPAWPELLNWTSVAWLLYGVGFCILLGLWLLQWMLIYQRVRRGTLLTRLRWRGHILPVHSVPGAGSPFVWGVGRSLLCVPPTWQTWSARRQHHVFLHELAHIQRRDPWLLWLAQICLLILWFHPWAWQLYRCYRQEVEHACDDFAVQHGCDPTAYAEDLLAITKLTWPQVTPQLEIDPITTLLGVNMASKSTLSRRIERLLDETVRRKPMSKPNTFFVLLLVLVVSIPLGTIRAESNPTGVATQPLLETALTLVRADIAAHRFRTAETQLRALLAEPQRFTPGELAQLYNLLGYCLYLQADRHGAVAAYERAVAAPEHLPAGMHRVLRYTLAQLHYVNADYAAAEQHLDLWFERAATPGPAPWYLRAQIAMASGAYQNVLDHLDAADQAAADRGKSSPAQFKMLRTQAQRAQQQGTGQQSAHDFAVANSVYFPLLKVAPIYPAAAKDAGLEGFVLVEFTVAEDGAATAAQVLAAQPAGVFDQAALAAVQMFRYRPMRQAGQAVAVTGVRNRITFTLPDGD